MSLATILLAAGRSTRFGAKDKLEAQINAKPMLTLSAEIAAASGADRLIAVLRRSEQRRFLPSRAESVICMGLMADSLRAGLRALEPNPPDKILILLADMPFVQPTHLREVVARCDTLPACATLSGHPLPPACFPRHWLAQLHALTGDQGAARLLRDLPPHQYVEAPDGSLRDIDHLADLRSDAVG